jgi:hypothetical protein
MNKLKLLKRILGSPENTRFGDMVTLVEVFGFRLSRVSGSHHIFTPGYSRAIELAEPARES